MRQTRQETREGNKRRRRAVPKGHTGQQSGKETHGAGRAQRREEGGRVGKKQGERQPKEFS